MDLERGSAYCVRGVGVLNDAMCGLWMFPRVCGCVKRRDGFVDVSESAYCVRGSVWGIDHGWGACGT